MMGKPKDQGNKKVPRTQRESSLSGILRVKRENPQPTKNAWSVGSKKNSIVGKKELWNGMKGYHEKEREDFGGRDTTKDSVVHSTRYAAMVDARDWASVTNKLLLSSGSTSLSKREC